MVSKPECGRYARTSPRHKARARTQSVVGNVIISGIWRGIHRFATYGTRPSGAFAACCASTASTGSNIIGLSATIARSCGPVFGGAVWVSIIGISVLAKCGLDVFFIRVAGYGLGVFFVWVAGYGFGVFIRVAGCGFGVFFVWAAGCGLDVFFVWVAGCGFGVFFVWAAGCGLDVFFVWVAGYGFGVFIRVTGCGLGVFFVWAAGCGLDVFFIRVAGCGFGVFFDRGTESSLGAFHKSINANHRRLIVILALFRTLNSKLDYPVPDTGIV